MAAKEGLMKKQVVEYAGLSVGILVPDADRFKFIAVKFNVHPLDGQSFKSSAEVLRAIHTLMAQQDAASQAA